MMKSKNIHWIFFILINFQMISSILFINQFNLPDGVLHRLTFDYSFSNYLPTSFNNYISNFDFYNISIIKNIIIQIYPSIKNECLIDWDNITYLSDSCKNQFYYNENFSFGNSEHLYNYSNIFLLNDLKIAHIIYLFILNLFFYLFILSKFENNVKYTALIFLIFPSIINNISYVSPNISSTYFQIILFYLFIKKFFMIYFILSIFLFNTDLQNISNIYLICVLFIFLLLDILTKYKIKFYQLFIIYFLFLLILYILKDQGLIFIALQQLPSIINMHYSDAYSYLNIGDSNFLRSLLIFGTSLYYIGGSMSHIAYLPEYIFFIIIFFLFVINFLKNNILYNPIFSNLSVFYFLSGIFVFLSLLIIFSNFNQGRYGFFLIPPILYFVFSNFKYNKEIFNYTFLIFFILNNFKILNFINSGM
tara:strand:- start:785 stop:2044 length:1260 start_codon:yes stop_codon:yes gene_type:complete